MNFGIIPARFAPQLHALLRIVTGLLLLEHGTGKILGFPHLPGLDKLPPVLLYFTGYMELIGGVLILIGFLTRPAAFVLSGFMAVAFWMVHVGMIGGLIPAANGGEAAVLYCFVFLYLAAVGARPYSVDAAMGGSPASSLNPARI